MKPSDFIPNTTQVPNIIFDEIMADLTGSELKVLLFFMRQRYGFQKFSGQFAYAIKQICEGIKRENGTVVCKGTGLSNRHVIKAIKSLHEKWHLITVKNGDWKTQKSNKYVLTIDDQRSPKDNVLDDQKSSESDDQRSLSLDDQRSLSRNQEKPRETNIYTVDELNIHEKWNSIDEIQKSSSIDKHIIEIRKAIKKHNVTTVCAAIDNYAMALRESSFFNYKWSLSLFMKRVPKFIDSEDVRSIYIGTKKKPIDTGFRPVTQEEMEEDVARLRAEGVDV